MHHLDVAHVVNGALPAEGLEGAVEDGEMFLLEVGRSLDMTVLVHVVPNPLEGFALVAEPFQRRAHRLVDDADDPAAAELLVLDE